MRAFASIVCVLFYSCILGVGGGGVSGENSAANFIARPLTPVIFISDRTPVPTT